MKNLTKSTLVTSFFVGAGLWTLSAAAATVNLNSGAWIGNLHLEQDQLVAIKGAVEKALNAPVDAEQQCGEVRLDCTVRPVREWTVDGQIYRELVITVHTKGYAQNTIGQENGQWPEIAVK